MTVESRKLRVLWISDFPIEWLPDAPEDALLKKQHSLSWQRVLFEQIVATLEIDLHTLVLRKSVSRDLDFDLRGVRFHLRHIAGGIRATTLFWADTMIVKRLVREVQPDVIHAWGSEKGAASVAGRLGVPYIVTVQGLMQWYAERIPLNRYERFAALLEKWSLPKANMVSTETPDAVRYLGKKGVRATQIEHASAPIFFDVVRAPIPGRLIFVGSFGFRKGADLVMAVLESMMDLDWELVVVGAIEPPLQPVWDRMKSSEFGARFTLMSGLTAGRVADELSKATLEVFPTRADTSPNAVKEAAVAGVPVVGTRLGGIPDYVIHEKNGLIVECDDQSGLEAALRNALAHPLFSKGQVDPDTLRTVREYLSPQLMKSKFLDCYRKLAQRGEIQ